MSKLISYRAQRDNVRALMEQRAAAFVILTALAITACAAITIYQRTWLLLAILLATLPILWVCYWLTQRGAHRIASETLVWSLAIMASAVLWASNGHYNAGVLALPCILIFAAILGTDRSFLAILTFFLLNIAAMGVAEFNGLIDFSGGFQPITRPITCIVILLASGLAMRILIADYMSTIEQLHQENAKVKKSEAEIAFLANHDSLTELPNRNLACERFEQAMQRSKRSNNRDKVALVFIDLDDFKTINDSLGHETGDRYLVAIAERLRDTTRNTDTVCRLGGDEFLLILEGLSDEHDVSRIAAAVQERIAKPVVTGQHKLVCSASIGIAVYPNDGNRYEDLVKKADIAMYRSKEMGRNTYHYYCESMNSDALERMQLLDDLRHALAHDELFLEYQPIVLLETGQVVGVEALCRWQHPSRGLIRPDIFIPMAEKSGLIIEIGTWVLRNACKDIYELQQAYGYPLKVAVNVSTVQLKRDDFKEHLREILQDIPIDPASVELEITESELIADSPEFDRAMQEIKDMGVSLAIDDFGTGYSNLGYVQKIKVAKLKIDRSFVHGIEGNIDNQAIVRAVHNIADGLIMKTVAEGVENASELDVLKKLGITHGQGYLWSRPVSIKSIIRLLQDAA